MNLHKEINTGSGSGQVNKLLFGETWELCYVIVEVNGKYFNSWYPRAEEKHRGKCTPVKKSKKQPKM